MTGYILIAVIIITASFAGIVFGFWLGYDDAVRDRLGSIMISDILTVIVVLVACLLISYPWRKDLPR